MRFKRLLLVALILPLIAEAAPSVRKKGRVRRPPPSRWQIRVGGSLMQESINLKSGSNEAHMQAQSHGLLGSANYVMPFNRSRWRQVYGVDLGVALVKGKGNTSAIQDSLRAQKSFLLGGSAGLSFRSSPYSELGISLPLHFRMIQWELNSQSSLDPDRDSTVSIGLAGHYVAHFTKTSALHASITYHFLWQATLWSIGWQHRFF